MAAPGRNKALWALVNALQASFPRHSATGLTIRPMPRGLFCVLEKSKMEGGMNKRDRPRWNAQGTPINAEAAMSDALLWLETIKPLDAQNRERLGACINALKRFCGNMT